MSDNPLDRILAKLDALEAGQTQLRVELMGWMERLLDDIGRIRDDIGVSTGHPERTIQAVDHTRKELRSLGGEVAAMWRASSTGWRATYAISAAHRDWASRPHLLTRLNSSGGWKMPSGGAP